MRKYFFRFYKVISLSVVLEWNKKIAAQLEIPNRLFEISRSQIGTGHIYRCYLCAVSFSGQFKHAPPVKCNSAPDALQFLRAPFNVTFPAASDAHRPHKHKICLAMCLRVIGFEFEKGFPGLSSLFSQPLRICIISAEGLKILLLGGDGLFAQFVCSQHPRLVSAYSRGIKYCCNNDQMENPVLGHSVYPQAEICSSRHAAHIPLSSKRSCCNNMADMLH